MARPAIDANNMDLFSLFHDASYWQLAQISVLGILLYFLSVAIYRLTLHPLAKYPGPLTRKLSGWPTAIQAYQGVQHLELLRAHEKYGPIVRVGPNMLSFESKHALDTIYTNRKSNIQKGKWYEVLPAASGDWTLHSSIDRNAHAFKRRVMSHAFSEQAMRSAESFVIQNVDTFLDVIAASKPKASSWTPPQNIGDWSTWLHFDIMGNLTFGQSFKCLTSDEHRYVPATIMSATRTAYLIGFTPIFRFIKPFLRSKAMLVVGGEMARSQDRFHRSARELMADRLAREDQLEDQTAKGDTLDSRKDFTSYLVHARDPETGLGYTKSEFGSESGLLIVAGADTTSTTFSACLFYLARNPGCYDKLASEIRNTFSAVDDIRGGPALTSCGYLRAVIDESLRLSPPLPGLLARTVTPGNIEVDGQVIPAGTQVAVSAYVIHHSPAYWSEPWSFKPDRWIADSEYLDSTAAGAAGKPADRDAFCPFSLGSRGCIGKNLAYLELMVELARLIYRFDFREARTSSGERMEVEIQMRTGDYAEERRGGEYRLMDYFVADRDGPMLEFQERER